MKLKIFFISLWVSIYCQAQQYTYQNTATFETLSYANAQLIDYNVDGFMDIVILGENTFGSKKTILYKNNGDNTFTDMLIPFSKTSYGSLSVCDYNKDGYPDIFINGVDETSTIISKLYKNTGSTFVEESNTFIGLTNGNSVWADIDLDGDEDLLITGNDATNSAKVLLYENNEGSFDLLPTTIENFKNSVLRFADFNYDGYPDLIVTGINVANEKKCQVYSNNKDKTFTNLNIVGLTGVTEGDLQCNDYNQDGKIDFIVSGSNSLNQRITKLYTNNGDSTFSQNTSIFTGLSASKINWCDHNNDGKIDVTINGYNGSSATTILYENNGSGIYTSIPTPIDGIYYGHILWSDFDNDNDQDCFISGIGTSNIIAKLFLNNIITKNTIPTIPQNTTEQINNDTVLLSWDKSTDIENTIDGIQYNLFISTEKNKVNIHSPLADITSGKRHVANFYNTTILNNKLITGLKQGKYYWAVQAIDIANGASVFSKLDSFIVCTKIALGADTIICEGTELLLTVEESTNDKINWYSYQTPVIALNTDSIKVTINANDTIWVQKNNTIIGCPEIVDTINIQVNKLPQIDAGTDTILCYQDTITIGGQPTAQNSILPYTYHWTSIEYIETDTLSNPKVSPLKSNFYYLKVKSGHCIEVGDSIYIEVKTLPKLQISKDTSIGAGQSLSISVDGAKTYTWSPNTAISNTLVNNPIVNPTTTTTYYVEGIDSNNCTDTAQVIIYVNNDLFIPDLFSPNNDGINDKFKVFGSGITEMQLTIYNRYGNLLFESNDVDALLTKGWDGTFQNNLLPSGTYVWTISGTFYDGTPIQYKGNTSGNIILNR